MGNLKKTILPNEWVKIQKEAKDPNCSLARLYDILRAERIKNMGNNAVLMGRSWFLGFMQNVCGAKDGKIGNRFRIPDSVLSKEEVLRRIVEETMSEATKPEIKMEAPVAIQKQSESMSEVFEKPQTMFFLSWVYQHNEKGFRPLLEAGYKRSIIDEAVAELVNLGIISKKDQRHYAFDWEKIRKDFPEIENISLVEHPEWMAKKKEVKETQKPEVKMETPVPSKTTPPKCKTIEEKMLEWLSEDEHPANQIVLSEVVNELRILGSKSAYQEGKELIEKWLKDGCISKDYHTDAYNILCIPLGSLKPMLEKKEASYTQKIKETLGLTPTQRPKQELRIQTGSFILRLNNGKDIEIRNNSNSRVSLTIEDGRVILQVQ